MAFCAFMVWVVMGGFNKKLDPEESFNPITTAPTLDLEDFMDEKTEGRFSNSPTFDITMTHPVVESVMPSTTYPETDGGETPLM